MRTISFLLAAIIVAAIGSTAAARQPARPRSEPVLNAQVLLQWIDPDTCWYRRQTAGGGSEFIRVDLKAGTRAPLFNPARLAAALSGQLSRPVDPAALPLETATLAAGRLIMLISDSAQVLSCDLESYQIAVASPEQLGELRIPLGGRPRPSRDGGPATSLLVVNGTQTPVSMVWLDSGGQRHPYGTIKPGDSFRQHTYTGHAWAFERPDGSAIGYLRARREPRIVVLDGKPLPAPPSNPGAGENSDQPEQSEPPGVPPRNPAISPDGAREVVFRDHNALLRTIADNSERVLTTDGTADDSYGGPVFWSPDSSHVVVLRSTTGQDHKVFYVQSSPPDQLQPKLHSYDYLKPGDRIPQSRPRLFDAGAGKPIAIPEDLFPNPWSIDEIAWAADSSRFTFLYNQRGHQVMRVIAVDAAGGAASAIVDEHSDTFIDYSQKTYRHDVPGTGEIVWASERDGWNHLYLYDGRSGKVINQITKGPWVVRGVDRIDDEHRQVWFRCAGIVPGQDPYFIHYARINFDGTGMTLLTAGDGTHQVSYSPDRRYIVDTWSRADLPPVTEIRRTSDGSPVVELERAECSGLLAGGWKPPTPLVAKGRDGVTDIYGLILWPRDFDESHRYPVVESIYAGPHDAFVPKGFRERHGHEEFTDRGFVVVLIDGMGTNWRSRAFHDVCWKNVADAGFPDRIAWIKAAAAEYPQLDLDNAGRGVGIYGGSAGGQNAMRALIDHHDFYKVCVADCGCHDNRMDKIWWNEAWMGWPVGPEYEASSNVAQAGKLEGKLLLVWGEMDENVDPASSMQVVSALVKADKDFEMLIMPNTGHGSAESPYGRKRRLQFFLKNLKGQT